MKPEQKVPPIYTPMDYTEGAKPKILPEGHSGILVDVRFAGANSNQMEHLVRKGMNLEIGSLFRKLSGTSKWYKRTSADERLWEEILSSKRFCFQVSTRVGASIATRPATLEETIAEALASGKSPEDILALVVSMATARVPAAAPVSSEDTDESEESEDEK